METPNFPADQKSIALKRSLVEDGFKSGHSCIHCADFVVRPVPRKVPDRFQPHTPFFKIATTRSKIRERAQTTDCPWWSMFRDLVRQQEFETKLFNAKDEIKWEGEWWSTEHYEALTVTLPELEREEYRKLQQRRSVFWGFFSDRLSEYESDDSVIISMTYTSLNDFCTRPVEVEVELSLPFSKEIRQEGTYNTRFFVLALPDERDLHGSQVLNFPVNTNPGSPESLELVGHWSRRCAAAHHCGILDLPPSLPSFLLAVGDADVRLIETTESAKVRYAALSYCWGTEPQSIVLRKGTMRHLAAGVPLDRFDATIRDAVRAVHAVGLRYLWVDALCIIQDDSDARGREIMRMHDIYRNATVTIIASRGAAVQDGFLSERDPIPEGMSLSRRKLGTGSEPSPIFKVRYAAEGDVASDRTVLLFCTGLEEPEPWYNRAWTMQETLLSGRRLQFGTRQTTWNCQHGQVQYRDSDGWVAAQFHSYTTYGSKELFDRTTAIIRQPATSTKYDRRALLWTWDQLVSAYSNRKLSYHGDRLPAISAIAREFARVLGDTYICGLWSSRLHLELMWKRYRSEEASGDNLSTSPSWAWASYPGGVTLSHRDLPEDDDFAILGSEIIPNTPGDPYGAIKSASITVRGLLIPVPTSLLNKDLHPALCDPVDDRHPDEEDQLRDLEDAITRSHIGSDDPKLITKVLVYDKPVFNSANVYLLVVSHARDSSKSPTSPSGLLLSKEGPGTYKRVGWFEVENIWPNSTKYRWRWFGRDMPKPARKAYRRRLRYLWGGEENIKEITIV